MFGISLTVFLVALMVGVLQRGVSARTTKVTKCCGTALIVAPRALGVPSARSRGRSGPAGAPDLGA